MKKTLLLLGLVFSFCKAQAQFSSPNQGLKFTMNDLLTAGAVTKTGNEYFVNQALTLESTDTLFIPTNETIKVGAGILLSIKGTLIINPPDSVKITSISSTSNFHTLKFEGANRVSHLKKTILEHSSGIRVLNSGLVMDRCIVRYNDRINQSGAVYISGTQRTVITNSKIYRNSRSGIMSPTNGATVIIRNNWLFENGTEPALYPQINLGPAPNDSIIISGNTIIGINSATNRSGGIAVSNLLGSTNVTNVIISRNEIRRNSYGLTIAGGNIHSQIKRNIIESNNMYLVPNSAGSGINFNTNAANQVNVVARNIIRNNLWGITVQSTAAAGSGPKPMLGRIGSLDTANVGMNQIYNNYNNGSSGQIWDLYNNTVDSIYAENNYWGTTNLTDIEDHIFHKTDDVAHGFVDYLPLFQPVVSGIASEISRHELTVYPNPAKDFVTLQLNGIVLSDKSKIRFFNALGQEVLTVQPKQSETKIEVNTEKFPAGIYTYRMESAGKLLNGKMMIVR